MTDDEAAMMDRASLVRSIAARTGRMMRVDDVLLDAVAINRAMLEEATDRFERIVKDHADRLSAASSQEVEAARNAAVAAASDAASRLINDAGDWATDRIRRVMDEATEKLRGEIAAAKADIEKSRHAAGMYCAGAFAALALTLAAAVGWYWTGI